jgi:hypothetical protein
MGLSAGRRLRSALAVAGVVVAGAAATATAGNAPDAVRPVSEPASAERAAATLTIGLEGRGSVTSAPAGISCSDANRNQCSGSFADGTAVTLTATPTQDWAFWGWTGACSGPQNRCTLSLRSDATANAVFIGLDVHRATFTARWRKSVLLGGSATIEAGASHAAELDMLLRFPSGAQFREHISVPAPGGRFTEAITFGRRRGAFPGRGYSVLFSGTILGREYQRIFGLAGLPAPAEGVVRQAFVSTSVNFQPRTRFPAGTTGVLAHFVFAALPRRGAAVTTTWLINGKPVGRPAKKPRARVVRTLIVVPGGRLPSGRYRCVLRAGGKIVAEASARIG